MKTKTLFASLAVGACAILGPVRADSVYFSLASGPLAQDWSNTSLITASDNWSGVPSIVGYRGDGLAATGADPQTVLADGTSSPVDVNANQSSTNSTTGGVTEFDGIANPTVALQGSGTAAAPFLLFHLDTLGVQNVQVSYVLRDLDGSGDNAVQAVALQYRLGSSGDFTNLAAGFVADATAGPNLSGLTTAVDVTLPGPLDNQAQVQLRIITTNAAGNDEWVGIDDIRISGTVIATTVPDSFSGVTLGLALAAMLGLARARGRTAAA